MSIERQARILFIVNAFTNWIISARGIIDPVGMARTFGGAAPNYPFMIRLWMAFVFMFGCMFWETSRDVVGKRALIKYNWIEKTLTATAVTIGYFSGETPVRLFLLIIFTNWLWIPIIAYYDFAIRRPHQA